MKAIIPVAGAGTKLRPHTYTQPKALIPVAGKPILSFIMEELIDAGVNDYIFIVGYLGEKIRDFVEKNWSDKNIQFVEQSEREGIGHAIWLAREFVGKDEELIIVLGDTVFDTDLKEIVQSPVSVLGTRKVDDPRDFGVAEVGEADWITRVVEKPLFPKSNLAICGLYKIKESGALFESLNYLVENNIRTKEEIHLTDALMHMIEHGLQMRSHKINNWFDCGKKESLLETNSILLKKHKKEVSFPQFENTIIIQPVSIARDCKISNSIIGPNVTIGENATVEYSVIKNSIIGSYANLLDVLLNHSLIGSDSTIRGMSQSLNIGDNTEIDFR